MLFTLAGCSRSDHRVVVACAQDREFAEGVFADFEKAAKRIVEITNAYYHEGNESILPRSIATRTTARSPT